ncbi:MAG TPA: cytochrome c [Nitrospirales bacterium]|nr:cytochrome c [Nitrospirales bacterium]
MLRRVGMMAIIGMASATFWIGQVESQRARLPKADLEAGERVYKQNCINCHGVAGQGDGVAAAKLDPKPADLTSAKTQAKEDAELLETIKFGRPGTAMPGWMSEIDEREMRDLVAYIRTLSQK